MRWQLSFVVTLAAVVAAGCENGDNPLEPDQTEVQLGYRQGAGGFSSGYGTPAIDGVLGLEEWALAAQIPISVNTPEGPAPATVYVMNDASNLYVALELHFTGFNRSSFQVMTAGPYGKIADPSSTDFFADVFFANSNYGIADFHDNFRLVTGNSNYGPADTGYGGTTDGSASFGQSAGVSVWDLAHPLNSGDEYDYCITNRGIGINFFIRLLNPYPSIDTNYPSLWDWIPFKTSRGHVTPKEC